MAIETTTMPNGVTKDILKEQNAQTKALNKNIQGLNSTLAKKKAQSFLGNDDYEEKSYKRSNKVQSDFDKKVKDDVDTLKKIRQEIKKTEEYFNDSKLLNGKALGLSKYQFASMQRATLQDSYSKMMNNVLDKKREMLKDFTYMRTAEGQASLAILKSEEKKLQIMRKQERLQKIEEEYQTELGKQLYGLKNELKGSSNMLMGPFRLLLEPLFGEEGLSKIVNEGIGNIFGRRRKSTGKATNLTEYIYRGNSDYEGAMSGLGTSEYESQQFDERLKANNEFKDIDKIASHSPNSIKAKEVLKFNSAAMGTLYLANKMEELLGDDKAQNTNVDFGRMLGKINVGNLLKTGAGLAAIAGSIIMGVSDGLAAMNYQEIWNTSGAATFIGGFLGGDPASAGTMEGFLKNAGKGGLMGAGVGLMVGGPMGAIAGFLIGGAIGGVMNLIGPENIAKGVDGLWKFVVDNKDTFLPIGGALLGLAVGGPIGAIAGVLMGGAAAVAINVAEEEKKAGVTNSDLTFGTIAKKAGWLMGGAAGLIAGAGIGTLIGGPIGTFVGGIAGFLIGTIGGLVAGAAINEAEKAKVGKQMIDAISFRPEEITQEQISNLYKTGAFDVNSETYKQFTGAQKSKIDFLRKQSNVQSMLRKSSTQRALLGSEDEKDVSAFAIAGLSNINSGDFFKTLKAGKEDYQFFIGNEKFTEKSFLNRITDSKLRREAYTSIRVLQNKKDLINKFGGNSSELEKLMLSRIATIGLMTDQLSYNSVISDPNLISLLGWSKHDTTYNRTLDEYNIGDKTIYGNYFRNLDDRGEAVLQLGEEMLNSFSSINKNIIANRIAYHQPLYFHSGGYAPTGKDEYPSILQKGELVLTESQAKYYDKIINEDLTSMKDTSQYMRENTKEVMEELLVFIKKLYTKLDSGKMSNVNQTNIISRYDMNSFTNSLGVI